MGDCASTANAGSGKNKQMRGKRKDYNKAIVQNVPEPDMMDLLAIYADGLSINFMDFSCHTKEQTHDSEGTSSATDTNGFGTINFDVLKENNVIICRSYVVTPNNQPVIAKKRKENAAKKAKKAETNQRSQYENSRDD